MRAAACFLVSALIGCAGTAITSPCGPALDGSYSVTLTKISGDCPDESKTMTLVDTVPTADCAVESRDEDPFSCSVRVVEKCGATSMVFDVATDKDGTFDQGVLIAHVDGSCSATYALQYSRP